MKDDLDDEILLEVGMLRLTDREEDRRLPQCEICKCYAQCFVVREKKLCHGCGQDEIQRWNRFVQEAEQKL